MALDLTKYLEKTVTLKIILSCDDELTVQYLPRQMTGNRLKASNEMDKAFYARIHENAENLRKQKEEGEDEQAWLNDEEENIILENYARHLSHLIVGADIIVNGKKAVFNTPEARFDVLKEFDYRDLQKIQKSILEDIARPTTPAGTSSSDGQPAKGEQLQETDSSG